MDTLAGARLSRRVRRTDSKNRVLRGGPAASVCRKHLCLESGSAVDRVRGVRRCKSLTNGTVGGPVEPGPRPAIFNCNTLGQSDFVATAEDWQHLKRKAEAFGWTAVAIDGHDPDAIE